MTKQRRTHAELWAFLKKAEADDDYEAIAAMSDAEIDAQIASHGGVARAKALSRDELVLRVKAARNDPRAAVAALFRGRKSEDQSSEEELRGLLADIERLDRVGE